MKKTLKSCFLLASLSALLIGCDNSSNHGGNNNPPAPHVEEEKTIDIILLSGQSNAAGYSPIQNNQTETFENVMYAGMTDKVFIGNNATISSDFLSDVNNWKQEVTAGLGYSTRHIGPEYGIAKYFNDSYDEDHKLLIVKTASGGTTLADVSSNASGYYGNWYPRSLWPAGYTPDIRRTYSTNKATGLLYKLMIENFKFVYNTLVEEGYEPNILGVCWSQGESDADLGGNYITNYGSLLETFIKDVREDVAEITGDDSYIENLPFSIAMTCPSYNGYNRNANFQIRSQQQSVAFHTENCEAIDLKDAVVVKENGQYNDGCEDPWHYNFADMTRSGLTLAESIERMN